MIPFWNGFGDIKHVRTSRTSTRTITVRGAATTPPKSRPGTRFARQEFRTPIDARRDAVSDQRVSKRMRGGTVRRGKNHPLDSRHNLSTSSRSSRGKRRYIRPDSARQDIERGVENREVLLAASMDDFTAARGNILTRRILALRSSFLRRPLPTCGTRLDRRRPRTPRHARLNQRRPPLSAQRHRGGFNQIALVDRIRRQYCWTRRPKRKQLVEFAGRIRSRISASL